MARTNSFKQADVTRAVKGAVAAGLIIREVVATKDGIRIISGAPTAASLTTDVEGESPFQKWKKNADKA